MTAKRRSSLNRLSKVSTFEIPVPTMAVQNSAQQALRLAGDTLFSIGGNGQRKLSYGKRAHNPCNGAPVGKLLPSEDRNLIFKLDPFQDCSLAGQIHSDQ